MSLKNRLSSLINNLKQNRLLNHKAFKLTALFTVVALNLLYIKSLHSDIEYYEHNARSTFHELQNTEQSLREQERSGSNEILNLEMKILTLQRQVAEYETIVDNSESLVRDLKFDLSTAYDATSNIDGSLSRLTYANSRWEVDNLLNNIQSNSQQISYSLQSADNKADNTIHELNKYVSSY